MIYGYKRMIMSAMGNSVIPAIAARSITGDLPYLRTEIKKHVSIFAFTTLRINFFTVNSNYTYMSDEFFMELITDKDNHDWLEDLALDHNYNNFLEFVRSIDSNERRIYIACCIVTKYVECKLMNEIMADLCDFINKLIYEHKVKTSNVEVV